MTLLDLAPRVRVTDRLAGLPVIVIGAGPIGLAAAANLIERGVEVIVLEAGDTAATSVRRWGHTRLFSPWRHLVESASRRLLEAAGWTPPEDDGVPLGRELVDAYLQPLAELPELAARIRFGVRVLAVTREGMDRTRTPGRARTPFLVRVRTVEGLLDEVTGRAVIDASGTYTTPNPLASSGLPARGEDVADGVVLPALPDVLGADRARFAGRHTTVVGAGHSAANTLLDLAALAEAEPGTTITWLIRNGTAARVSSSPDDELEHRTELGARVARLVAAGRIGGVDRFQITELVPLPEGRVRLIGTRDGRAAAHDTDVVVNATGFRPDLDMLREIRLGLDDVVEAPARLAPLIDPNLHSCGTVAPHGFAELAHPDPGFFLAGMKSYGRAPTFLLATGYEQVRSIAAWLDGDMPAATQVRLTLPATGVCSTDVTGDAACCGLAPAPTTGTSAAERP